METFSEYRIRKEILIESPFLNGGDTPEVVTKGSKPVVDFITSNHSKSDSIGDGIRHLKTGSMHLYYRHDGKLPKEISVIDKNIQVGVNKGSGGDSSHIRAMMLHHLTAHGKLESSNSNTMGSKNLWTRFIKDNRHAKFSVKNDITGEEYSVDHSNIDKHSPKIWGDSMSPYANIRLHAIS